MPKSENKPPRRMHRLGRVFADRLRRAAGLKRKRDDWHWFDHPEMQERIAKAEADRREGRVTVLDREAAQAYFESLG
jgi:hypothetical protein